MYRRKLHLYIAAALLLSGCGSRTVLVPDGTPVRLAEPISARIYVQDPQTGQWIEGSAAVTIPQGWYAVPPPTTNPSQ